jgi:DNA-binding transcriptional ArsR family regulator
MEILRNLPAITRRALSAETVSGIPFSIVQYCRTIKSKKYSYISRMARFTHPRLEDVPLDLALHALADPNRLGMVARLAATERLNCTGAAPCDSIPKSTLSNHLKLLRAAGLIETTQAGREMINTLRRADFDRRFPGLLDAVLANHAA